jgi:hypothetical protein
MTDRFEMSPDENLSAWLQPDVTAAFETRKGALVNGPERRLMSAVLEDAIHSFQKSAAARTAMDKAIFAEEEEWLFGADEDGAFSFESICDALGLDADYLRSGLRRWIEKKTGKQARPHLQAATVARKKKAFHPHLSMVPLLLAEDIPAQARRALLEDRPQEAGKTLMKAFGLSCAEAALLVDANPCA